MGKMSNIDLKIQYIKQWFKNQIPYITMLIIVYIIAILMYGQADRDIKTAQEKENRINTIESRLNEQMNYIHELEADVDNLYKVVEQ